MLRAIWGDEVTSPLGFDPYYQGMACAENQSPEAFEVYLKIVGVLNLPPDVGLIKRILDKSVPSNSGEK